MSLDYCNMRYLSQSDNFCSNVIIFQDMPKTKTPEKAKKPELFLKTLICPKKNGRITMKNPTNLSAFLSYNFHSLKSNKICDFFKTLWGDNTLIMFDFFQK